MDEVELEDRLAGAAPRTSRPTAERERLLRAVVRDRVRPQRMRRPLLAVGVAGLVFAGGATAAVATAPYEFWFGVEPDRTAQRVNPAGELCTTGYLVAAEGAGVPDDDPAVLAAREILAGIDFANLPIDQQVLQDNRDRYAEQADEWAAKGHSRDLFADPDADTISWTVATIIGDGLRERGLDPSRITLSSAADCAGPGEAG